MNILNKYQYQFRNKFPASKQLMQTIRVDIDSHIFHQTACNFFFRVLIPSIHNATWSRRGLPSDTRLLKGSKKFYFPFVKWIWVSLWEKRECYKKSQPFTTVGLLRGAQSSHTAALDKVNTKKTANLIFGPEHYVCGVYWSREQENEELCHRWALFINGNNLGYFFYTRPKKGAFYRICLLK